MRKTFEKRSNCKKTENCDNNSTEQNTGNSPIEHAGSSAEDSEGDPAPGPSMNRTRKRDGK